MKVKNKEKDNGVSVKDFVSDTLKNIEKGINEAQFELTTDDGKTLHHKAINKVKFKVGRK